jgi:hypothetical protein
MHDAGVEILAPYIERMVVVPEFQVAGTFDRIVRVPDGRLVIADVKSARDVSYSWVEIAVQMALYSRGHAIWNKRSSQYEPMPDVDPDRGLVMHVPVGKGVCMLYEVDLAAGWTIARLCAQVRTTRSRKDLATPLKQTRADGAPADGAGRAALRRLGRTTLMNGIKTARSEADLIALWEKADADGSWTDEATEAAKARKAQLAAAS